MINTTVLWELYARTHDKLVLSAVGIMQVIPVIALFIPAGTIADRFDRRLLATVAALGMGTVGIGLAIASALGAPVAVYLALLLLQGCVVVVHSPATSSLLANLGTREELPRANRMLSSLSETAQITAPAVAGLALLAIAPQWVYSAVGITALTSATLYRSLPATTRAAPAVAKPGDWRIGLRFIFRSPLLLSALTLDMFAILFAGVTALLPAIATDILHVGPFGYGILRASQPVGAVAMALIGGRLRAWKKPGRVLLIVVALYGLATMGIGLSTWLPITAVCLVACGGLDNISVVIRLTLEQLVVPDAIRGRVSAVHYVFIGMSNELGAAESGLAAKLFGTVPAIVGGGVVAVLVVATVVMKWPQLADMPPLAELRPPDEGSGA
ncbi:MAG: arabinose efflux permease family protein [Deltaproteobacteria bacterium]|nr:arabinose efflux permease family protein [Deltaproteobacteria bacterium]